MTAAPTNCPKCQSPEIHQRKSRGDWVCDVCEHAWKPAESAVRVFLSYGRRDASELADRLCADLETRGCRVWMDRRQIRSGKSWEQEILDGLRDCQVFVAVLSPHAVRTEGNEDNPDGLDSVCLDEISYARFSRPPKPIVPVMAVPCEPPFCIFRLDYVNLTGWCDDARYRAGVERLDDALKAALAGQVRYRGWEDRLRPWDFSAFLEEKRKHFCGREWLFAEIDRWRTTGRDPALLITGDPGTGKSAVVAELVHRNPGGQVLAYHCCQADTRETLQPARFVRSVAAMIASRIQAYGDGLASAAVAEALDEANCARDPASAFETGVLAPLAALPPPGDVRYLLVDALDEALLLDEGRVTIIDVLATRLARLPSWLRIVVTTRKDPAVLERLRGLRAAELDAHDPRNLQDVERYVLTRLRSPELASRLADSRLSAEAVAESLRSRADGNILYVVQALEGVERDRYRFDDLGELPPGLYGLYEGFFRRQFPDEEEYRPARALLEVVAAAREPLVPARLAEVAGLEPAQLPRLLRPLAAYLPERDGRVAFYHKSFADWLTAPDRRGSTYHVEARRGHQRLANLLVREYNRAGRGLSAYGLAHLPHHLAAAGRDDDNAALLCTLPFLEAKAEAGRVFDLVADFLDALERLTADHPRRSLLRLLEEALLTDVHFLARHPTALFQCLWNRGWWYDCADAERHYDPPEGGWPAGGPPWQRSGPKLSALLESWRTARRRDRPAAPWLRALRPPPHPLGAAQRAVFRTHEGPVAAVAFSPDGRRLASGGQDHTVRVWDADRGAELLVLRGHTDGLQAVCFSPDGRSIASCGLDRTVRLWDVYSGTELHCMRGHNEWARTLAFTPDGQYVLSGSEDWSIRVWRTDTGEFVTYLIGQTGGIGGVAVSADGRLLVSGSAQGSVVGWDLPAVLRRDWKPTGSVRTNIGMPEITFRVQVVEEVGVMGVALSADGRRFLATLGNGTVVVMDAATRGRVSELRGHGRRVWSATFSPDSRRVVSGSSDGTVRLWDTETGDELACLFGHESRIFDVAFSPDGRRVASASHDGTVRVWDASGGSSRPRLRDAAGKVRALAFAPDGQTLASGGEGRADRVQAPTGEEEVEGVRLWILFTGTVRRTLPWPMALVRSLTFSADGRMLAAGAENGAVSVWQLQDGRPVTAAQPHTGAVLGLAFSPDGRLLASGSWDETVRVCDAGSGRELLCLRGHRDRVGAVAFSPDGRQVVSRSADGTIRTWSVADGRCVEERPLVEEPFTGNWRAKAERLETVVAKAVSGPIAWLPATPTLLTPHPSGRLWAGVVGNHVMLFALEGVG